MGEGEDSRLNGSSNDSEIRLFFSELNTISETSLAAHVYNVEQL